MMDMHEFAVALREIENLPDTEGGGIGTARQERKERLEFCYKRRNMFEELQAKIDFSLAAVCEDIQRLTEEERVELAEGPKPSFRRRATDILTRRMGE
jgi:hypothetical protein